MKLNCTTPLHLNKSQICKTPKLGFEANRIHERLLRNNSCLYPCKFLSNFVVSKSYRHSSGNVALRFKPYVQNFKAHHTYTGLDLFAALGGYMGLFLGVSVFHIKDAIVVLIQKIFQ